MLKSSNSFFLLLVLLSFLGCENPYKEFIIVPNEFEDPNLIYHFQNFSGEIAHDDSENNQDGVIDKFETPNSSINNSTSYIIADGKGSITIPEGRLDTLQQFSLNLWLRSYAGNFEILISQGLSSTDGYGNRISIGNDKLQFGEVTYDGQQLGGQELLNELLLNGEWNMITVTAAEINRNTLQEGIKLFINGNIIETTNNSNLNFLKDFPIKITPSFTGDVDNIRIYNKEISSQEILGIYQEEKINFPEQTYSFGISDNLFSYYTFDNETSTDFKEGRNGIPNSSLTFSQNTPTLEGFSASFQQENAQIEIDQTILDKINTFSISFWMKSDSVNYQPLFTQGIDVNGSNNHGIIIVSGEIYCGTDSYNFNFDTDEFSNLVLDGNWHMITIICQKINQGSFSGDMTLYIDNVPKLPKSGSSDIDFLANLPLLIGNDGDGTSFKGCLDNIRFYNKYLTSEEITNIYLEEKP